MDAHSECAIRICLFIYKFIVRRNEMECRETFSSTVVVVVGQCEIFKKKNAIEKDADDEVRPLFIPISVDGDATAAESGATSRAVFVRTKYYSLLCLAVIRIMYARRIR